jgi:hypothetical protein
MSLELSSISRLEDQIREKHPHLLPPKGAECTTDELNGVAEIRTRHLDNVALQTTRYIYLTSQWSWIKCEEHWIRFSSEGQGYEYLGSHKEPYLWYFPQSFLSEKHLNEIVFRNDRNKEQLTFIKHFTTENFLQECEERVKKPLLTALSHITGLVNEVMQYLSLLPPAR